MNKLIFFVFIVSCTMMQIYANTNNPNSKVSLRKAYVNSGFYISGTQTRAEVNSCSYNEYRITGTFYSDAPLICEVWDDGIIRDSTTALIVGTSEQSLDIYLSFEGIYLTSSSGVGIYCHEEGSSTNIFEEDPFYPTEITGECPSESSSSSLSLEEACRTSGGIYTEEKCIYPDSSQQSCESIGREWVFSLGTYECREISSSSSSSSSSSIDPDDIETAQVQQRIYIDLLEKYEYGSNEQKQQLEEIKTLLENDENILHIETTDSGNALWVSYRDGFDGLISTTPQDSKGSISIDIIDNKKNDNLRSKIGNNKVLSMMAQYYTWGENDDIPVISALLNEHGYEIDEKKYIFKNSGNIDDFKNWDQYGIVLISSHGEATSNKTAIHINTDLSKSDLLKYQDDLREKRLIIWGDSYGITESFIEKYNDRFPNTLVYMSICKGAYNDTIANVITEKGAASYLSYDNYVDVSFAKTYGVQLFEDLLKSNGNLSTAYISGIKETDNDPAELKLFGDSQLSIQLENTLVIDKVSVEDIVVKEVGGKSASFDGHFIHYASGAFDWIYILASGYGVYKLNGLEADGHIQWSENLVDSFERVLFSTDGKSIIFASAINEQEIVQILENNEYIINGHFVHYASGAFDWIYVTASGAGVYKLNGLKEDGKFEWSDNLIDNFSDVIIDSNNKSVKFDLDNESLN